MDRANQKRTPCERPFANVHVRRQAGMLVNDPAVSVQARRTSGSESSRLQHAANAEDDQHRGDGDLERIGKTRRHFSPQQHESEPDDEKGSGVANSPARTEERSAITIRLSVHERGHRGNVIRFERVAHAEQRRETGTRDQFEYGHNEFPPSRMLRPFDQLRAVLSNVEGRRDRHSSYANRERTPCIPGTIATSTARRSRNHFLRLSKFRRAAPTSTSWTKRLVSCDWTASCTAPCIIPLLTDLSRAPS